MRGPGLKARHAAAESLATSPEVPAVARERSLLLARVLAWSLVPLYVAGICAFLWLESRLDVPNENPVEGTMIFVGFGAFAVVGALLVARRPANPVGWIMAALALMVALFPTGDMYAAYVMITRGRPDALAILGAWIQSWYWILLLGLAFVYLPLLFPDGRLPSRRWLPVAVLPGVGILGAVVLGMLTDTLTGQEVEYRIDNPIGVEGLAHVEELPVFGVLGVLLGIGVFGAVAAVVVRFRRSRGVERQQIKWFLYAVAPLVLLPVQEYLPEIVSSVTFGWMLIALPTAIGISVLRYRLYDIDLLINRTLVYGTLTAGVVGVYVFVVGYLGAVFRTGGNLGISLVATGIVAVLFAPLRDRLQRAANRLMYGERDEPYAVVSRLGERLESTLAPDAVLPAIATTVREALKLPYAAVALPRDGGFEVAAASGKPPADSLRLPLSYQGETVGELLLGARAPDEEFSAADRRLLNDLAHHAGVAVHGVRVMADLRRSRERLVLAREEERRRLRRDLHDELAPTLAALGLAAATVGELIPADPKKAVDLNAELQEEIRSSVGEVRRLVYDLRPPTLDELGLAEAIRQRAARYNASEENGGLRITVEASGLLAELPAAVEVAAYRIVQEALMNVVRHAGADACTVRLACPEGRMLDIEITDDGVGLPESPELGVGLWSMQERAAELGGSCRIENSTPAGTRIFARLPFAEPAGLGEA
jgi:signal transduction histidine kinase